MKEVQEFCRKYDAQVGASSRLHRRSRRVSLSDWQQDFDAVRTMPYEEVPCVEIHMPEDRFRALMEHDHWLEREFRQGDISNGAVRIARDHERECRIRNEHPGVQAAWEQYQIMLRLADTGS